MFLLLAFYGRLFEGLGLNKEATKTNVSRLALKRIDGITVPAKYEGILIEAPVGSLFENYVSHIFMCGDLSIII